LVGLELLAVSPAADLFRISLALLFAVHLALLGCGASRLLGIFGVAPSVEERHDTHSLFLLAC